MSTSEIETSRGNETVIETLSIFENVSSVRDEEIALDSGTQNESEMQIWTQRISDKTNKEVANLRKEMDEKLEKILKEIKNRRRTQSVPSRRYQEQNTPRAGTSKYTNNESTEENASEPENQECEIQDNPFRPSNLNELRTPVQPLSIQSIDLNDSVVINEDRTGEDYHRYDHRFTELNNQIREITSIVKAFADQINPANSNTGRNTSTSREDFHMMLLISTHCVVLTEGTLILTKNTNAVASAVILHQKQEHKVETFARAIIYDSKPLTQSQVCCRASKPEIYAVVQIHAIQIYGVKKV